MALSTPHAAEKLRRMGIKVFKRIKECCVSFCARRPLYFLFPFCCRIEHVEAEELSIGARGRRSPFVDAAVNIISICIIFTMLLASTARSFLLWSSIMQIHTLEIG